MKLDISRNAEQLFDAQIAKAHASGTVKLEFQEDAEQLLDRQTVDAHPAGTANLENPKDAEQLFDPQTADAHASGVVKLENQKDAEQLSDGQTADARTTGAVELEFPKNAEQLLDRQTVDAHPTGTFNLEIPKDAEQLNDLQIANAHASGVVKLETLKDAEQLFDTQIADPHTTGTAELENPKDAEQLKKALPADAHPALQLLDARPDVFRRQGYVVATYRRRNGKTFGPYYVLNYRENGRQLSVYLGRPGSLVDEVRQKLHDLQSSLAQYRQITHLQRHARVALRAEKAKLDTLLRPYGLRMKGFEVRGWRFSTLCSPLPKGDLQPMNIGCPETQYLPDAFR